MYFIAIRRYYDAENNLSRQVSESERSCETEGCAFRIKGKY